MGTGHPVGRSLTLLDDGPAPNDRTVIAVVDDAVYESPDERHLSMVYLPLSADHRPGAFLLARTRESPTDAIPDLARVVRRPTPGAVGPRLSTMQTVLASWTDQPNAILSVLEVMSMVVVVLFLAGLGASLAHLQSARTRETAIRIAIGASPAAVAAEFMYECLVVACSGALLGVPMAFGGIRVLGEFLHETRQDDLFAVLTAVVCVSLAVLAAGVVPAVNASRVNPSAPLRDDR